MGTLLRGAEVREPIELSFGVVSGVTPGIHVLDGGSRVAKGRGCLGIFRHCSPIGLNGQNDSIFRTEMYSTRS